MQLRPAALLWGRRREWWGVSQHLDGSCTLTQRLRSFAQAIETVVDYLRSSQLEREWPMTEGVETFSAIALDDVASVVVGESVCSSTHPRAFCP